MPAEIWDPKTHGRRLTLFEEPQDAPSILAMCEARMWEGFYVPLLTAPYIAYYWGQCAANDPNGTWAETLPRLAGWDNGDVRDLRLISPSHDGDPNQSTIWYPVEGTGTGTIHDNEAIFALDRLPWRDA